MKRLDLLKIEILYKLEIEILYKLEILARKIWLQVTDGQSDHWFDSFPALFYRLRKEAERNYKEAERNYVDKYKENIYGLKL